MVKVGDILENGRKVLAVCRTGFVTDGCLRTLDEQMDQFRKAPSLDLARWVIIRALALLRYDEYKCIGASACQCCFEAFPDSKTENPVLIRVINSVLAEDRPGANDALWVRWKMLREQKAVLKVIENSRRTDLVGMSALWSLRSMRKQDHEVDKICAEGYTESGDKQC